MKALIPAYLVLAVLNAAAAPADPDPLKLGEVYAVYRGVTPDVTYSVHWQRCGFLNAFYVPGTQRIELCSELLDLGPAVVRFVLAHELAHAVINQRSIPYTGSQEAAADELAAVLLTIAGHDSDVIAAAKWWHSQNGAGGYPHPPDRQRATAVSEITFGPLINPRPYRTWALLLEATSPE